MSVEIRPVSGDAARQPGDTLEMRARWSLQTEPKNIEVRLFWFTQGKGHPDLFVAGTLQLRSTLQGDERVKFKLPEAPYSFSGRLITLKWAVEIVADDENARWEFVLSPTGREVTIRTGDHARMR